MKANTQYNDYVGTCAADESDFQTLKEYLTSLGVDTNRFQPIGATFYVGNVSDFISFSIICTDSEEIENKAVKIDIENAKFDDVFSLFKRLDVLFTYKNYQDYALRDEPIDRRKIKD